MPFHSSYTATPNNYPEEEHIFSPETGLGGTTGGVPTGHTRNDGCETFPDE